MKPFFQNMVLIFSMVGQLLAIGLWFSPGTPVSSTNKTDLHDITEILLKVALSTINQTKLIKNRDNEEN
jgi:hypothetical protein